MFTPNDRAVVLATQGRPLTQQEIIQQENNLKLENYKHIAEFLTSKFEKYFVCVKSKRSLFGKLLKHGRPSGPTDINEIKINGLQNKDYCLRSLVDDKKFIIEWNKFLKLY